MSALIELGVWIGLLYLTIKGLVALWLYNWIAALVVVMLVISSSALHRGFFPINRTLRNGPRACALGGTRELFSKRLRSSKRSFCMKVLNKIDLDTVQFLMRLKALNEFWYEWVLVCAKTSPKTARMAINEAYKQLSYEMLNPTKVNVFQICRAVNSGELDATAFAYVDNADWKAHLDKVIQKIKKEGVPLT
jgi:hypothetical protein